MKRMLKKTSALVVAAILLVSTLICPISAVDGQNDAPETLLALGDSLTTGYGLDNYVPGENPYLCNSYINTVAKALGLEGGSTYINRAVNGDQTADLLNLLPRIEDEVKAADMIVISIGGNDLLGLLPEIASHISGRDVSRLEDVADVLLNISAEEREALATDSWFLMKIAITMTKLNNNLDMITSFIQEKAPDARVIFLLQFNPLKNVPGLSDFGEFAQPFLDSLNTAVTRASSAHGFETVNIPSVINCDAAGLTNILQYDIHPNEKGHLEMAKLLAGYLGVSLDLSHETESPAVTEPATEPTEESTEVPTEAPAVTTEAPEETTHMPETTTYADTEATPTSAATEAPDTQTVSGCSGSAAASLLLITACAAFVLAKKRF